MANIERGTRIRERREELHLTQPAVVDLLEQAANALPATHDLHPAKAGKAPVTLRGYQSYEQGGGIVWEKAKLLAQVLQMDVQTMMNGEAETTSPAPEPFAETQLDRIERLLGSLDLRITELERVVDKAFVRRTAQGGEIIERLAALEGAITQRVDESAERLAESVQGAVDQLRVAEEPPAVPVSRPARKRTPSVKGTPPASK